MEKQKLNNLLVQVISTIALGAVIVGIILLFSFGNRTYYSQEFVNSLQDSIRVVKVQNGKLAGQISVLETTNANDLLKIKTQDSTIQRLQSNVKYYKSKLGKTGSVTVVEAQTHVHNNLVNTLDSLVFNDKWIDLSVHHKNDPAYFDLTVRNQPTIVIGEDNKGTFAQYSDENPYVQVKDIRAYKKKHNKGVFEIIWDAKYYILGGFTTGYIMSK